VSAKICGYCGRENADESGACRECGTKLVSPCGDGTGECRRLGAQAPGRGSKSGFNHEWALAFGTCHLALSVLIVAVWALYFRTAAMSDAYHAAPSWVNALFALLWVLQTPAAAVETVGLRHSQHGADCLLLGGLGILWSFALGYAVHWIKRAFDKNRGV
jgi:hypothetical protein